MTSSSTAVRSANETVWHAAGAALYAGDIDTFLTHWQSDGRYEVAYPVAGLPPVVEGHAQLRDLFTGFATLAVSITVDDVRFHATTDPDVAFVEEHMTAELHDGGRYENDLCLRVTFCGGRIASIFEYYGQRAHEELVRRVGIGGLSTMAITHAGDVFENPATRETGRIITGAADTDGRYMQSETRVRPGGAVSVAHRHPGATERFEVLEGELTVQLDGRTRTLTPGEQVTIAPGAAHHYANTSHEDVVFRFDVWPAARFEALVVTLFALGTEGRTDAKGAPSPLQMAVILDEYGDVLEVVGPPRWLQRLVIPLLARIGRARGLRASYPRHDAVYARWQQHARAAEPLTI